MPVSDPIGHAAANQPAYMRPPSRGGTSPPMPAGPAPSAPAQSTIGASSTDGFRATPLSLLTKSPGQLDAEKRGQEQDAAHVGPPPLQLTAMAAEIKRRFGLAQIARQDVELDLLKDLRQRDGIYESDKLSKIREQNEPPIFDNVTDTQCTGAENWMKDLVLFQGEDRPWDLKPAYLPTIGPDDVARIEQKVMQGVAMFMQQSMAATGQPAMPSPSEVFDMAQKMRAEVEDQIKHEAKEKARRMADKIADQFNEGGFEDALAEVINHDATFRYCVFKGPVLEEMKDLRWGRDAQGRSIPQVQSVLRYRYYAVHPLDFWMSAGAKTPNDGDVFERVTFHDMDELQRLRGVPYYSESAIDQVIERYGSTGFRIPTTPDPSRQVLEDRRQETTVKGNVIESIIFTGEMKGKDIRDWYERSLPDLPKKELPFKDSEYYAIQVHGVGDIVIKAVLNPDPIGHKNYFVSTFRKKAGSAAGESIPGLIRDDQDNVNANARTRRMNMKLAGIPQAVVDLARMAPGEPITEMFGGKIWQTDGKGQNQTTQPVHLLVTPLILGQLMQDRDAMVTQIRLKTGIPAYEMGQGGTPASKTWRGQSALMEAAARGIRSAIYNLDVDIIKQVVHKQWLLNMLYDPDESLKGDVDIESRGALALLIRSEVTERQAELLEKTANPMDMQIMGLPGRANLLRRVFTSARVDPDGIVPPQEHIEAQQQQMEEAQAAQAQANAQAQAAGPQQPQGAGQ